MDGTVVLMQSNTTPRGGVLEDLAAMAQSAAARPHGATDAWTAEGDVLRALLSEY